MAELSVLLKENDFTLTINSVNLLPNQPTRAQIEDALGDNGIALPLVVSRNFYLLASNGKGFIVVYSLPQDTYYYEKFNKAT